MKYLRDLTVLVLGLGDSGLAMARWCARCGATVRVWDSRDAPPQAAALAQHVPGATLYTGALEAAALDGVQLVLKSPGLASTDGRIAGALDAAAECGALVQGELDLFARALADLRAERGYAPQVLAITGTNGKTTTTAMTAQLLARTGARVAMAGNIGPTLLQTLADALDMEPAAAAAAPGDAQPVAPAAAPAAGAEPETTATADDDAEPADAVADAAGDADANANADATADTEADTDAPTGGGPPPHLVPPPPPGPVFLHLPEVWVLELSSFQLDRVRGFEPTAAAVLNLSEDHLDWHGSMAAYAEAKGRIWGRQALLVVNADDAAVEALAAGLQPEPVTTKVGGRSKTTRAPLRPVTRFGLGAPRHPGDWGLVEEGGMAWLVRALPSDETRLRPKRGAVAEAEELIVQRLMPADALRVRGRHNAANALAALALATATGRPIAPMLHALRDYAGEPHRVQHLGSVAGVDAFDDSKGTNVGATVAAIAGLGADRAPARLVVILGGDGKGQDFTPLAAPLRQHARAVATLGRDAPAIEAAVAGVLQAAAVPLQRHTTLEAATRWSFEQAQPGDAVLLSPACASLDMFRHYAHRAEVFAAEVLAIAADRGEVLA